MTTDTIKTVYFPVKGTPRVTHIKAECYYSLGGYNVFTGREEKRGYVISASPVERSPIGGVMMESYTAFTGKKYCFLECARKSKKKAYEAVKYFDDTVERFCNMNFPGMEIDFDNAEVR